MSGPFGSQQWMYSEGFYPYEIDQSLRFNDDDSAYLSRTPASAGNRKTWTWSSWVKRGNLGIQVDLFGCQVSGAADVRIGFLSNDTLYFYASNGTTIYKVDTNAVFRDVGSWYHIFVATDTTQATETDRVKVWVNGVQQTLTEQNSGYPPQNYEYPGLNTLNQHNIGIWGPPTLSTYYAFDGYMAEINFVDGQALDPTSFGENKSGVWIPKRYSGSYGTNGFYLDFGNSGSLGADSSGNSNNWTPTNLAATDQVIDSPTNNFATLNPLAKNGHALSEGNCKYATNTSGDKTCKASYGLSSGKWYWEAYVERITVSAAIERGHVGITGSTSSFAGYLGEGSTDYTYYSHSGNKFNNNTGTSYGATYGTGDLISVALDMDSGTLEFYKNGVSQGTAFSGLSGEFSPALSLNDGSSGATASFIANFGQDSSFAGNKTAQGNTDANGIGDFYYSPPSGYLALCTANLPDPVAAIDPALDANPQDYFNTVLYTGNASANHAITGVGFQPDWLWIKNRTSAQDHCLVDVLRTAPKFLESNTTAAEVSSTIRVTSFDSDGFTVGIADQTNGSGHSLVAWNWKAGGTGVSNTDGTITSTVSANVDAGFSIVTYTGNGTGGATIGHGLDSTPSSIIVKRRDAADGWFVYWDDFGGTDYLVLSATSAKGTNSTVWNNTNATSSVFSVGTNGGVNASSGTYVAYCFHSVEGFSKFGKYTGNGSSDGPFVYCGFRPAFVMVKNSSGANDWITWDALRNSYNIVDSKLSANTSSAEFTSSGAVGVDFLSNGFKIKGTDNAVNDASNTYIYMAFAEMPFKYSTAR